MMNRDALLAELQNWVKTNDGRSLIIQFVEQHGKYNVNLGEGTGVSIGDTLSGLDTDLLTEIRDMLRSSFRAATPTQLPSPPLELDWQQTSRTLLEERLQLTTNPMTKGEDIAYQVEQVYVPLGLVERKKVPRQKQDVSPEQGSRLYQEGLEERSPQRFEAEEVEVTQKFEHEQFLEQVLQQGQSPKSQGKRVAIIGEPGAGKTTLLQQIARWAAATFPDSIVIWISLADLQGDSLETYLEKRWLQRVIRAAGGAEPSQADKANFAAQFKQGRVWLLLDGLDEMQVSGNPLTDIQRQMQEGGWLQQAKILLTCRLNLWDGDRNSLTQFDTYRTLEFAYPDQVEQFIRQWFAPRRKAELGQSLCAALKESGKERIRDLVKNPLRLTLLCFNWYLQQGQLPETQAELYQRFVNRIYEWKHEQFPTTPKQQAQLNQALAKLALAAIDDTDDQHHTRFRLRHPFVSRILSEALAEGQGTLLDLALEVGWLNQVGVDANDPMQAIYAFYHATFEEYFAALAIDNGRFFLNPKPRNAKEAKIAYRIFEPQWKQVFLLWLGRKDVNKSEKDALIWSMMRFKDRCGGFYSDRAFLLAARGIAEFRDCTHADEIVNKLVYWAFDFDGLEQSWFNLYNFYVPNYDDELRQSWINLVAPAFSSTDSRRAIRVLAQVLKTTQSIVTFEGAVKILGRIGAGSKTAIQVLVQVLETTQDQYIRRIVVESLEEIDPGNETAIRVLVQVLETTQNEIAYDSAARLLGEIGTGNETAISAMVQVLETTQEPLNRRMLSGIFSEYMTKQERSEFRDLVKRWRAVETLGIIGAGNETAIRVLLRVLETTQDLGTRGKAFESLGEIGVGNETAIRALVQLVETTEDDHMLREAAEILSYMAPSNETAIQALLRVLETTEDDHILGEAFESLGIIGAGNETAIQALVQLVETTEDDYILLGAAEILGRISAGNETAIHALMQLVETTEDDHILLGAAEILDRIGAGNETAIWALVRVLETTQDKYTLRDAAESLYRIDPGNETAIRVLVQLIKTTQDKHTLRDAAEILGKIGVGNETAIHALIRVLETTQDEYTLKSVAKSLDTIDPGNETAIRALLRVLIIAQGNIDDVAKSLSKIDPSSETIVQALAQLIETTQDNNVFWRAVWTLNNISIGMSDQVSIQIVRSLRRHLRTKKLSQLYPLMMKCAETMPYPDFYQAFHSR
ncbi:MAG: HEAT repeat domain-containing protein [Oculatellaceae cyanobacterium bins.114]|nr:HEAT repeat domain-containing protein [Oculatellaceae cyanobacterium bins.114]